MRNLFKLGAPLALALALMLAPVQPGSVRAQIGPLLSQPLDQLSGDAFDQAFLAQMTMHHAMAVMMARPLVANGQHQELKDLGSKIIEDQTREIGQMRAWARDWYGLQLPDMVAMMDQGQRTAMPGQPMQPGQTMPMGPGQQTAEISSMSMIGGLWDLPPNRLDAVFMSMMVPHHQDAVDMANLAPDRAVHQELKDLARAIVDGQSAEIAQMNEWLAAWYGL